MEQLNYNLLFRWFVGLSVDDPVWDPSTFSKNRERVLNEDFAASFLDAVLNADKVKGLGHGRSRARSPRAVRRPLLRRR